MQFLKNPFYIYIISFLFVIFIHKLGWSTLYPPISIGLLVFFIFSFLTSLIFGAVIDKYKPIRFVKVNKLESNFRVVLGIYLLYILEFINNKGVPLISVLTVDTYDYALFGIKTLHPILTTYTSFYTVYVFHLLLSDRTLRNFIKLMLLLIIPILLYNRGMFLINAFSMVFVFLMSVRKIKKKVYFYFLIGFLAISYMFGVLGNYRLIKQSDNWYFLNVSKATDEFKESIIPKEFMWVYIYGSSPLANLQNTINLNPKVNNRLKDFLFTELVPDFLVKRIAAVVDAKGASDINRLTTFMTVGTVYSKSYILLGWAGIILMYLYLAFLMFFYILLIPRNSKYYVTGISILCTFILFNTFDNMIFFSGISFQLIFPLLLSYRFKKFTFNVNTL